MKTVMMLGLLFISVFAHADTKKIYVSNSSKIEKLFKFREIQNVENCLYHVINDTDFRVKVAQGKLLKAIEIEIYPSEPASKGTDNYDFTAYHQGTGGKLEWTGGYLCELTPVEALALEVFKD